MSKETIRILVVDDEIEHADALCEAVVRMGFAVRQAHGLSEAQRLLAQEPYDLVITDLRMDAPDDGFELLESVKRASADAQVIMVTAHGDVAAAVRAMKAGAFDFIQKPLDLDLIRQQVRRAVDQVRLTRQNANYRHALDQKYGMDGIIGQSSPMMRALQLVRQIAPTDISVLIAGESGTGKELIARALHQNSHRAGGRFVALNCAGLNESTLEDELFGHVRGAFTDARTDRQGRFEYADHGTLFLDEIGDMPMAMQAKLLRVLQDRQITRLGSNEPIQVDVRFVSATNKNLEEAIAKREFRDDLYFRIKGAAISLAPLRQRREDIPLLIKHLMEKIAKREGKPLQHLSNEARDLLVAHDWPGNVRQLENVIESMTALSTGSTLTLDDIPPDILGQFSVKSVTSTALAPIDRNASTQSLALPNLAGVSLAELEREAIEKTLQLVQGNREQAAKMLGIGERTLYRKIKEYDIVE